MMSSQPFSVRLFVGANGRSPYTDWLEGIKDRKTRAVVGARVSRLGMGNIGHCRDLKDGVWEMKIDYGPGYRVYFAHSGRTVYLLLLGGDKRTQDADIKN